MRETESERSGKRENKTCKYDPYKEACTTRTRSMHDLYRPVRPVQQSDKNVREFKVVGLNARQACTTRTSRPDTLK